MGNLSAHFSGREFACHHCGALTVPPAALVDVLERIRALTGKPLIVVSGYRCPTHNRAVGGATLSQHVLGFAADIPAGRATYDQAVTAGARGVGTSGRWATHVDVRAGRRSRWVY